tara:strand:+ start:1108 stop:1689 length:582 start_codon:yes stop_codon:yes gene_type:complete
MAYDASDFGQNDPTESAAAVGNAMGGNFSASDFGPTNQDLDPFGGKGTQDVTFNDATPTDSGFSTGSGGIMSVFQKAIGYKPNVALSTNLYNMMVPGQNTPLGALSFIAGPALGLNTAAQLGLSLANRGIGSMNNPFGGKTQAQIDATTVYDRGRQPVGPPTNMGIMDTYKGAEIPTISMQSLPQLYADDFYE